MPAEPPAPVPAPAKATVPQPAKTSPLRPKPDTQKAHLEALETRVLAHFRKPLTARPGNKRKLVSFLLNYLGKKVVEAEVLDLIDMITQAGQLVIDDKGKVTYHLET